MPNDRTVTYFHIVVDLFPQKADHSHVYITTGSLVHYPNESTIRTTAL